MTGARPWVKYVAVGCGGLLVVVVGLVATIFFTVTRLTAAPEQVARDFLTATSRGDFAAAHERFATPLREKQPLSALEAAARETPSIFKVSSVSFSERSIDTAGARLAGTATLEAGTQLPVSFTLVRERDAWRLLAYQLGTDR